jgi:phosphohistidine phosphatase SixA
MADNADTGPNAPHEDSDDAASRAGREPEQLLEEWGRRVGRFLASAAMRAREEAEDILAEAQSIRRGERE